jgi:hypothetical protein
MTGSNLREIISSLRPESPVWKRKTGGPSDRLDQAGAVPSGAAEIIRSDAIAPAGLVASNSAR